MRYIYDSNITNISWQAWRRKCFVVFPMPIKLIKCKRPFQNQKTLPKWKVMWWMSNDSSWFPLLAVCLTIRDQPLLFASAILVWNFKFLSLRKICIQSEKSEKHFLDSMKWRRNNCIMEMKTRSMWILNGLHFLYLVNLFLFSIRPSFTF